MDTFSIFDPKLRPTKEQKKNRSTTVILIIIVIVVIVLAVIVVYVAFFRSTSGTSTCSTNLDCPAGQVCNSGVCQTPTSSCNSDNDCALNQVCFQGTCVTPSTGCTQDSDCMGNQVCQNGTCVGCDLPSAPTSVLLSSPVTGTLVVDWLPVTDATIYNVYVGIAPGFTQAQSIQSTSTSGTTAQFSGLNTPFTYYVFVTAANLCGPGAASNEANIFLQFVWPNPARIRNGDPNVACYVNQINGINQLDSNFCSTPANDWIYDVGSQEIRASNDQTKCIVATSQTAGAEIQLLPCAGAANNLKQWLHDPTGPKICLISNQNYCFAQDEFGGFFLEGQPFGFNADQTLSEFYPEAI